MKKASADIRNFFKTTAYQSCQLGKPEKESASSFPEVSQSRNVGENEILSVPEPLVTVTRIEREELDLGDITTGPSRPILNPYPSSKIDDINRQFSSIYFEKFNWIEYSVNKDAVFCYPCRIFPSGNTQNILTEIG